MPQIISVPTPCHEDWNAMTQKEQGRHCGSCSKTVIDFTTWQPQEILFYFKKNKNICGRFTAAQLNEPIPTQEDFVRELFYLPISTLKRVAAIFLFAFVVGTSSCNDHTTGKVIANPIAISKDVEPKNIIGLNTDVNLSDTTIKISKHINIIVTPNKYKTIIENVKIVERPITMGIPAVETHFMGDSIVTNINENKPVCNPIIKNDEEIIMGKMIMPTIDSNSKK